MKSNISHCLFMLVLGAQYPQYIVEENNKSCGRAGPGLGPHNWVTPSGGRHGGYVCCLVCNITDGQFDYHRSTINTDSKKKRIPIHGKDNLLLCKYI